MIVNSDNNALALLSNIIKPSVLKSLYNDVVAMSIYDLQHSVTFSFINTKQVSYFFRVLYNATYLTNDLSEQALTLLSETDYKNGLVAGVPDGMIVAHKFGQVSLRRDVIIEEELHDCGIIYHPRNPYFLCVMTKSFSTIPNIENVIKRISTATYQYENSR